MSSKYSTLLFSIAATAVLALQGCKSTDESQNSPTRPQPVEQVKPAPVRVKKEPVYKAEPGLLASERYVKALALLQTGKTENAKVELQAYLQEKPKSQIVKQLIKQIETPAKAYFPDEFFEVVLQDGESISTLAEKYLGSALEFVALAKYNDIENASLVLIGQKIKIPKTAASQAALLADENEKQQSKQTEETQTQENDLASEHTKQTDKPDVIDEVDVTDTPSNKEFNANDSLADTNTKIDEETQVVNNDAPKPEEAPASPPPPSPEELRLKVDEALSEKNIEEAKIAFKTLLDSGATVPTDYIINYKTSMAALSEESAPLVASQMYLDVAQHYDALNRELEHFKFLRKAAELNHQDSSLNAQFASLREDLSDFYHRRASSSFRRQELDDAIADWDLVLVIDPNHENARVFRAQALELQEKLDEIK